MSTVLYDLAARLRAARDGRPNPRMGHAPQHRPSDPVAVTVERGPRGGTVLHAGTATTAATGRGGGAAPLGALTQVGVSPRADTPPTLVVPDPTTLGLLARLARQTGPGRPHADPAAVIAWWDQRADHPGSPAVLVATEAARTRWVLGTAPDDERDPATWRRWLGITATGPAGMLALAEAITTGDPLPGVEPVDGPTEQHSWHYHRDRLARGWDWRWPDTRSDAALGLATRTDAAELYESLRLDDPVAATRESFAGNVVAGTVTELGDRGRIALDSPQMICRLRTDTDVQGWRGQPADVPTGAGPAVSGRLAAATVTATGGLGVTLTRARIRDTRGPLAVGDRLSLRTKAVDPAAQRHTRSALAARYRTAGNWLGTGRTPAPRRRDVPLAVAVAAAETD